MIYIPSNRINTMLRKPRYRFKFEFICNASCETLYAQVDIFTGLECYLHWNSLEIPYMLTNTVFVHDTC